MKKGKGRLPVLLLLLTITGGFSFGCGASSSPPAVTTSTHPPVAWVADGNINSGEYRLSRNYASGNYEIHWKTDALYIYIGLKVKTAGWVAVGLGTTERMNNADMVFASVVGGQTAVSDQFSNGEYGPHEPDTALGGANDIEECGGKEQGGFTIIEFKRLLDTSDKYDRRLTPGVLNIIWAYGSADDFTVKHINRGYGSIDL